MFAGLWPSTSNFYPRPPRGGRPQLSGVPLRTLEISIHALREEGDETFELANDKLANFYPRPPRGGRLFERHHRVFAEKFLSTPSARRATCECIVDIDSTTEFLSTPSARRATPRLHEPRRMGCISIHALREEGDGSPA